MEQLLIQAEQCIIGYQSDQLKHWAGEQRLALQRSAILDNEALAAKSSVCESCIHAIRTDMETQRAGRHKAHLMSSESLEACEEEFRHELQALGDAYAAEAAEISAKAKSRVRHTHDAWEEKEWDRFDNALRAVMLKHAQLHHGFGVVDGVAELWEHGEFQAYLDEERNGWALSQRSDIEHLHADIDAESESTFQALESRLKDVAPEFILGQSGKQQLDEIADAERRRLTLIESELHSTYRTEIDEALSQCEESYRGYDCELQRILVSTLEARIRNAACMRQYKLALCRWRLEYQQIYHEHCDMMFEQSQHNPCSLPTFGRAQDADQQRLDVVRRLVQNLWSRSKPPVSEVAKFLAGVCEASAQAGLAMPLIQVYEDELQRYGALPLVEHASRPELLECWLQALQWDGRRGSISQSPGKSPRTAGAASQRALLASLKPGQQK